VAVQVGYIKLAPDSLLHYSAVSTVQKS
jgi:hypothetical protein